MDRRTEIFWRRHPGSGDTRRQFADFCAGKGLAGALFCWQKAARNGNPSGSGRRGIPPEVWKLLCEIPYGEVTTYGSLAKKLAAKLGRESMSGQAVGGAVGHNPISILIPCHRVVGTNGSLTGYAGGLEKKIKLLALEGVDTGRFFVPKKGTAL